MFCGLNVKEVCLSNHLLVSLSNSLVSFTSTDFHTNPLQFVFSWGVHFLGRWGQTSKQGGASQEGRGCVFVCAPMCVLKCECLCVIECAHARAPYHLITSPHKSEPILCERHKFSFRDLRRFSLKTNLSFWVNEVLEKKLLWALKSSQMLPVSFSRLLWDKCVCVRERVSECVH